VQRKDLELRQQLGQNHPNLLSAEAELTQIRSKNRRRSHEDRKTQDEGQCGGAREASLSASPND